MSIILEQNGYGEPGVRALNVNHPSELKPPVAASQVRGQSQNSDVYLIYESSERVLQQGTQPKMYNIYNMKKINLRVTSKHLYLVDSE